MSVREMFDIFNMYGKWEIYLYNNFINNIYIINNNLTLILFEKGKQLSLPTARKSFYP